MVLLVINAIPITSIALILGCSLCIFFSTEAWANKHSQNLEQKAKDTESHGDFITAGKIRKQLPIRNSLRFKYSALAFWSLFIIGFSIEAYVTSQSYFHSTTAATPAVQSTPSIDNENFPQGREEALEFPPAVESTPSIDNEIEEPKEKETPRVDLEALNDRKNELKTGLDIVILKYEVSEYRYDYYIDPNEWYRSNVDDKEALFKLCAEYGSLFDIEKVDPEKDFSLELLKTKIKNYSNGEVLGKYSLFGGYKFK
jgi:hypothetical protein